MKKNTKIILLLLAVVSIIMVSAAIALTEHRVQFEETKQTRCLDEDNNLYVRIGICSQYCGKYHSKVEHVNGSFDCVCMVE